MTVCESFHAAGIVEDAASCLSNAGECIESSGTRSWCYWFIGKDLVVHWRNMNMIFFNGVGADTALLAGCISFKAFGLTEDVAYFAEEANDVIFEDSTKMGQDTFIFSWFKSVHRNLYSTSSISVLRSFFI